MVMYELVRAVVIREGEIGVRRHGREGGDLIVPTPECAACSGAVCLVSE